MLRVYASCADAYATYKDITKGALSTIVNGFKNGLSYSDIRDSLKPYDDSMFKMFFGVRMTVAHQGYGLDKLINDDYWGVRA